MRIKYPNLFATLLLGWALISTQPALAQVLQPPVSTTPESLPPVNNKDKTLPVFIGTVASPSICGIYPDQGDSPQPPIRCLIAERTIIAGRQIAIYSIQGHRKPDAKSLVATVVTSDLGTATLRLKAGKYVAKDAPARDDPIALNAEYLKLLTPVQFEVKSKKIKDIELYSSAILQYQKGPAFYIDPTPGKLAQ